jgi:precorrin-6A/cobalt-precorrin-6A reductase
MAGRRVLILGGTAEALDVAARLNAMDGITPVTSMAGVTLNPRLPEGTVRRGGFGGAEGLAAYLRAETITVVVDATHPFAARISRHAAEAGARTGVPVLHLVRPAWERVNGDSWHEVAGAGEAADWLDASRLPNEAWVFLTIGRSELAAFAEAGRLNFIARSIEAPEDTDATVVTRTILERGPFSLAGERRLLSENNVACLVAKNSGGLASYPKIEAARELGLPVVIIQRPPSPMGETVSDVAGAIAWIETMVG